MSLHHGLRSAAGASVADPYFANTSLLLLGNGTNGAQNNTFVDGSSSAFSITRYGNTTQGTFSPFGYNWSNYFDGSGDRLTIASNAAFGFGTGDFTVEFWIYPLTTLVDKTIYHGTTTNSFIVNTSSTGKIVVRQYAVADLFTTSAALNVNAWNHVAIGRSGSTLSVWLNGSRSDGATGSNSNNWPTTGVFIGDNDTLGREINAYLSNLRVVKGSDVYGVSNSAITVPTTNLTAITNTSLLTCQSNRFIDNSSNAFAITPYGNAAVTNFAPFPTNSEYSTGVNGGSGYFDGSGDYLSIAANSAIQFGTGDYTIDFWVYPLQSGRQDMIDMPGTNRLQVAYEGTNTAIYINQTFIAGSAVAPTINAWNHIAATRSGTSTRVFLNGTQLGSTATNSTNFSDNSLKIVDTTSGTTPLKGYLAGLRVVKGGALYTASYTVPTAPPTTTVSSGTVGALLNFTNASIIDSTGRNDIETVGDAQVSTSTKKYGTGALKFDGTGDWLLMPANSQFAFGSGDYTVECWIYINSFATTSQQLVFGSGSSSNDNFYLSIKSTEIIVGNKVVGTLSASTTISTATWYHIAASRSGTTLKIFKDGTQVASGTDSKSWLSDGTASVGVFAANSGLPLDGYIDDLRVSKVCRYSAAFTPPTRQLPAR